MVHRQGFVTTNLLATTVEEPHRIDSILDSGAYNGYPMKNDRRETLVTELNLESGTSDGSHEGGGRIQID